MSAEPRCPVLSMGRSTRSSGVDSTSAAAKSAKRGVVSFVSVVVLKMVTDFQVGDI